MTWQDVLGHDEIFRRFQRASQRGRLAGSFLFIGPSGIGKRRFAFALAEAVLCKGDPEQRETLEPCGDCESCRLFRSAKADDSSARSFSPHPDLYYVFKPADKTLLPLELLIGDKDHRGRAGLCYDISRTPYLGHRKVAVLDDADFLNAEGANALLKTLEEPPPDSILILIGTSTAKQLPTIRSRCQIVRFAPLEPSILASILFKKGLVLNKEQGLGIARRAGGSFDQALILLDGAFDVIRDELHKKLLARSPDVVALAARLNEIVEEAGKEATLRRQRLRLIFQLAIDFFRERIKKFETVHPGESAGVEEHHQSEARISTRRLERTLDALDQIDRNANLPVIVDAWCHDLAAPA